MNFFVGWHDPGASAHKCAMNAGDLIRRSLALNSIGVRLMRGRRPVKLTEAGARRRVGQARVIATTQP
jgi:hypothetical protein